MNDWNQLPQLVEEAVQQKNKLAELKRIASDREQPKHVRQKAQAQVQQEQGSLRKLQGQITQLRWHRWFKAGG